MTKLRRQIDRVLEWLLIFLMGLMVVNVTWQVLSRFVMRDPSSYTEELARFLLIWLGLLGAGYCAGKKSHLAIDILISNLSATPKRLAESCAHLVIMVFALIVMVAGGLKLVQTTLAYQQTSAALQIPLGYVYLALPISGVLILFYSLDSLVGSLSDEKK